jgi:hypothetical protein
VVVRLHDQRGAAREVALRFASPPSSAAVVGPLEDGGRDLAVRDGGIAVPLAARELVSVRVRFNGGGAG